MKTTARGRSVLLTYCTNVHPADDLEGLEAVLDDVTARVARAVAGDAPFGLGLRLGEAQLAELDARPDASKRLDALLARHRLFVFTINGFPQTAFHARVVKENVYRPDWSNAVRTRYTLALAKRLAAWLPADDRLGTISTLPVGWRPDVTDRMDAVTGELWQVVDGLARIERETGARVMLCLEPEPECAVETVSGVVALFDLMKRSRGGLPEGLVGPRGEELLHRHLGVCYDVCHQSVLFADVAADVAALGGAGIAIGKVQVSNALRLPFDEPAQLDALVKCAEERFLHQVAVRNARTGEIARFTDLPDLGRALAAGEIAGAGEARCHFHVPIYAEAFEPLETTRADLEQALSVILAVSDVRHFEVETYTFDVLPPSLRAAGIEAQLVREIEFARSALGSG